MKINKLKNTYLKLFIFSICVATISFITLASCCIVDMARWPLEYSSVARQNLRTLINKGDQTAIDTYEDYIEHGKYLFDGPVTVKLFSEANGLNYDEVNVAWASYQSINENAQFTDFAKGLLEG